MDVFEIVVSITCLTVLIGIPYALFYIRKLLKTTVPNIIGEQKAALKRELEDWLNSEKGAKALYSIGVLIAQGAKDSLPFISKGGKFKWTDLIGQIAGKAASKFLGVNLGEQGEQTEPQTIKGQKAIPEA